MPSQEYVQYMLRTSIWSALQDACIRDRELLQQYRSYSIQYIHYSYISQAVGTGIQPTSGWSPPQPALLTRPYFSKNREMRWSSHSILVSFYLRCHLWGGGFPDLTVRKSMWRCLQALGVDRRWAMSLLSPFFPSFFLFLVHSRMDY